MSVIGVSEVETAGQVLRISPGDVVTPLARDRADELGVAFEVAGDPTRVKSPAPVIARRTGWSRADVRSAGPVVGQSGALYRRGGPLAEPDRTAQQAGAGGERLRIAVIGAGHVGAQTAACLAEADVFSELVLVDVVEGLAEGVALDIWHSAPLRGFSTRVRGSTDLSAAAGCSYVVITAGRTRQPGMSRTDLGQANATIVRGIARGVAQHAPDAVIVVVTNPLDEMTELVWRETGFPPSRVLGMAGVLDAARFAALAGLAGAGRPDAVHAISVGSHGDEMVIPISQATASGRSLASLLDAATLDGLLSRTRNSGAEVVRLLGTGSAYFAPAAAVCRMVLAMAAGSGVVLPACVRAEGAYGIEGVYLGLPARLGREGVIEVVELRLSDSELEMLRAAAARIAERVHEVV